MGGRRQARHPSEEGAVRTSEDEAQRTPWSCLEVDSEEEDDANDDEDQAAARPERSQREVMIYLVAWSGSGLAYLLVSLLRLAKEMIEDGRSRGATPAQCLAAFVITAGAYQRFWRSITLAVILALLCGPLTACLWRLPRETDDD